MVDERVIVMHRRCRVGPRATDCTTFHFLSKKGTSHGIIEQVMIIFRNWVFRMMITNKNTTNNNSIMVTQRADRDIQDPRFRIQSVNTYTSKVNPVFGARIVGKGVRLRRLVTGLECRWTEQFKVC